MPQIIELQELITNLSANISLPILHSHTDGAFFYEIKREIVLESDFENFVKNTLKFYSASILHCQGWCRILIFIIIILKWVIDTDVMIALMKKI